MSPDTTHARAPIRDAHDCDRIEINDYEAREVLVAAPNARTPKKAIQVVIRGRHFHAMGQVLTAYVGEEPLQYVEIHPDERGLDGVLLRSPKQGARVRVALGDLSEATHPRPFDPQAVRRL